MNTPARGGQKQQLAGAARVTTPDPLWREQTHDAFGLKARVLKISADVRQREPSVADTLEPLEANAPARQHRSEHPRKPDRQRQDDDRDAEEPEPDELEPSFFPGDTSRHVVTL